MYPSNHFDATPGYSEHAGELKSYDICLESWCFTSIYLIFFYSEKPGRACSKQYFKDFAVAVVAAYDEFHERPVSATGED